MVGDQETEVESEKTGYHSIKLKIMRAWIKVKAMEVERIGYIKNCFTSGNVELVKIWFEGWRKSALLYSSCSQYSGKRQIHSFSKIWVIGAKREGM